MEMNLFWAQFQPVLASVATLVFLLSKLCDIFPVDTHDGLSFTIFGNLDAQELMYTLELLYD